ncbi:MAG: glutamate--tRNA ligase [archaeon]
MAEISKDVIKAYALENAIKHDGKANQGAVLAGLFAEGLKKSQIKDYIPIIQQVINEVNKLSQEKQEKLLKNLGQKTSKRKIREGLPKLPNAKQGEVVMRFQPFPSGPLHIGNAKTLILNDEYVKMYGGKLLLIIDDTIGSEDKPIEPQAYKLIEDGIKWLEVNYDKKVIKKSDRIEKYYAYAEELIKKGYMYVCDCKKEKMHELKVKGIECSCRQFHPELQLRKWKNMFTAKEGSMCVRLKTDMADSDPAFRDRVMFRISDRQHAILGNKYRIYPLLDFSAAIDDHVFGITHILRGMELAMETRIEKFIWNIFGWKHPEIIYNGHFEIEGIKISKSKGAKEVKEGIYSGWNDPRTWSLQSLRDRGISPKAIREFVLNMGLKKTNITIPVDVLYSLNRKTFEETPRYFFIEKPVKIKIKGCPEIKIEIPFHQINKLKSRTFNTTQEFLIPKRDFDLMENKEYRLMHLLNFKSSNLLSYQPREFSFTSKETNSKEKLRFMQWLVPHAPNIDVTILMPNGSKINGLGEPELIHPPKDSIAYFERFGFVKLNNKSKDSLEFWFAHS